MKKPYAEDWVKIPNTDLEYSKSKKCYWSANKSQLRDQSSAEWAGWIGPGAELRQTIKKGSPGKTT